ncbi:Ig-like domain-containing protein [Arsenophonus endosymbiont of Aleurodicus floccissimus]|uniref:Ig-like domain-containing protein n=1 Tax=Arsenophonus endosymbiont of Aleurodicus floccissimus TaxID=2152761 RepID=UPI000E6B33B2|nr:Ig-like domain-containing protein [Arsenophonus endosymbiont of Aleurodicus floccissimus]
MNFVGDIKTAKVGNIILNDVDNNKIADGNNGFEFSTQLVDHNRNPVKQAGLVIKWRQEKGTIVSLPASSETDSDGRAPITLKSSKKAVDNVVIYAQYGTSGEEKSEAVNFIANINTAKIKAVTLDDKVIDKVADGINDFTFIAQLVDQFDSPIKVVELDISWLLADDKAEDAHLSAASSQTDKNGLATIKLISTNKAVDNIVVSAQYGTAPKIDATTSVNFIADVATTRVGSVTLVDDIVRKVADGKNHFTFKAKLVDKHENLVKVLNLEVNWQQDTNGNYIILPASSKTNSDGQAMIELQSTNTAVNNITVSARYNTSEKKDAE